jgi:hypothetical protein
MGSIHETSIFSRPSAEYAMMSTPTRYPSKSYASVQACLPPFQVSESELSTSRDGTNGLKTLVVLDDDPTGTQTVRNVSVLTTFEKPEILLQLKKKEPGFFILTNSRAYHRNEVCLLDSRTGLS